MLRWNVKTYIIVRKYINLHNVLRKKEEKVNVVRLSD